MATVNLENVTKIYEGKVEAVKNANLDIKDKEFIVLVGPSGCGKTTTLRMVAGLEEITRGKIRIGERVVNDVEPKDRDIAMVFQNYALYPHMTVYQNMAFGLKLRKFPKDQIDRRVKDAARILNIEELLNRKPKQLSGGQRQRVAVGRAIVRDPKVFLFDEPLSNLDAKLRVQMRAELKKLHQRLETTAIYVTHDQVEAMTMGDRIVILRDGIIQQVGTPLEVYLHPENRFVAGFIGSPPMNFIPATLISKDSALWVKTSGFELMIPKKEAKKLAPYKDKEIILGLRPENIYDKMFAVAAQPENTFRVKVDVVEPMGNESYLHVLSGSDLLTARVDFRTKARPGEEIDLVADMNLIHAFDKQTEKVIL